MDVEKRPNYRRLLQNWMTYYRIPPPVARKLYTTIRGQKAESIWSKGEKDNGDSMEKSNRTGEE